MFPYEEVFILLTLAPLFWYWIDSLRARETAVRVAAQACSEEGLQLLDETVSGSLAWPCRDEHGHLQLRREYGFEFSDTGDNRQRGSLILEGRQVTMLQLRPRLYIVPRPEDIDAH